MPGTAHHSTYIMEATRCALVLMPMGMVLVKALTSQCMPTSCVGRTMTTCHGPSRERSPSRCWTNWKIRTTTQLHWGIADAAHESNKRVVNSDRGQGYGWMKFILCNWLGYDAEQNCQYLKDDCLYFRVAVEASDPLKPWLTCTN